LDHFAKRSRTGLYCSRYREKIRLALGALATAKISRSLMLFKSGRSHHFFQWLRALPNLRRPSMWAYGLVIDATNTPRHKVDSIPVPGGLQLLSICSMPKLIPAFLVSLVITLVV
jgi:hypothetical protein